jgi:hypothetical protein
MPTPGVQIPPDDPPDEELSPEELHDRVTETVDLTAGELRDFRDSELNQAYLDENSEQAQDGNEPLNDAITLLDTPADEWRDEDDGFNEVEQARELLDFHRSKGGQVNESGLGENYLTDREEMQRAEAQMVRWGDDPDGVLEW